MSTGFYYSKQTREDDATMDMPVKKRVVKMSVEIF